MRRGSSAWTSWPRTTAAKSMLHCLLAANNHFSCTLEMWASHLALVDGRRTKVQRQRRVDREPRPPMDKKKKKVVSNERRSKVEQSARARTASEGDLQGSLSLRLCQREQSSAASLLSTVHDEEKKSGRRERCHSVRPAGCETIKISHFVLFFFVLNDGLRSSYSPVSDNRRAQGWPHARSASNTTSPCWRTEPLSTHVTHTQIQSARAISDLRPFLP